ncbi:MAG: GAF domain-containing protein [Deltaproteobacteria bacterium]|nr:GAF domain-containing protein [Deltaproteobacteria bacterium]
MNENYHTKTEELKHAEEINEVLFRISNAVNTTKDLSQLYATIHQALAKIIDVTNFYIALYDSEKRTLHFPYYKDEKDKNFWELIVDYDVSDSLTGQVIIDKEPVLLDRKELLERKAQNRYRRHGSSELYQSPYIHGKGCQSPCLCFRTGRLGH